jgi:cell division protein FtsL
MNTLTIILLVLILLLSIALVVAINWPRSKELRRLKKIIKHKADEIKGLNYEIATLSNDIESGFVKMEERLKEDEGVNNAVIDNIITDLQSEFIK